MQQDRRRHPRQPVTFPLYVGLNSPCSGGILNDLGEEGIGLDLVVGPQPESGEIIINLELPGTGQPFEAKGRIAWAKTCPDKFGLKFVDLTEAAHVQITSWIAKNSLTAEPMRNGVARDLEKYESSQGDSANLPATPGLVELPLKTPDITAPDITAREAATTEAKAPEVVESIVRPENIKPQTPAGETNSTQNLGAPALDAEPAKESAPEEKGLETAAATAAPQPIAQISAGVIASPLKVKVSPVRLSKRQTKKIADPILESGKKLTETKTIETHALRDAVHFVVPRAGQYLEGDRPEISSKRVDLQDVTEKLAPAMQSSDDLQRALRRSLGQLQDLTVAKQNAEPDPADRDALYKWVLAAAVAFMLILALAAARWIYTSTAFDNISSASDIRDAIANLFGSSSTVPARESTHDDKSKAHPTAARAPRRDTQKLKSGKAPPSDTSALDSNATSPRFEVMDAQNGRRRVPPMRSTVTVPSNQSPPAQTTHISGSQPASPLVTQEQIVRMVGHVSLQPAADVPVEMVLPEYPVEALQKNEEGRVTVYATISRDGTLQNIRAVGGSSVLADSTLKAIKTWRYQPHTENGRPVETETRITIDFKK
jgi:TonB family protein